MLNIKIIAPPAFLIPQCEIKITAVSYRQNLSQVCNFREVLGFALFFQISSLKLQIPEFLLLKNNFFEKIFSMEAVI